MSLYRDLHHLQYSDGTGAERVEKALTLIERVMVSEAALKAAWRGYCLATTVPPPPDAVINNGFHLHGRDAMRAAIEAIFKEVNPS